MNRRRNTNNNRKITNNNGKTNNNNTKEQMKSLKSTINNATTNDDDDDDMQYIDSLRYLKQTNLFNNNTSNGKEGNNNNNDADDDEDENENDDDDYDDDDDDNDDDDNNKYTCIDDTSGTKNINDSDEDSDVILIESDKKNQNKKIIELPGGRATISTNSYSQSLSRNQNCTGEASQHVVQYIRNYIDMLFSSVALEAMHLTQSNQRESILAIPGIVSSILEYNNIMFNSVKFCKTKVDIPEPVWYMYSVSKNELILFFDEVFYDDFCMKVGDRPVTFTNGIIPIELMNPYETDPNFQTIDSAMIHCAIIADHVAQHIIIDLMGTNKILSADIHDRFTSCGTTLHSIFFIEQNSIPMPKQEYNNYMTMLNLPTISNATQQNQIMRSTQGLINNFLMPQQFQQNQSQLHPTTDQSYQQSQQYNTTPSFRYTA